MYLSVYIHIYIYISAYIYVYLCIHIYKYTDLFEYLCTHMYIHKFMKLIQPNFTASDVFDLFNLVLIGQNEETLL